MDSILLGRVRGRSRPCHVDKQTCSLFFFGMKGGSMSTPALLFVFMFSIILCLILFSALTSVACVCVSSCMQQPPAESAAVVSLVG